MGGTILQGFAKSSPSGVFQGQRRGAQGAQGWDGVSRPPRHHLLAALLKLASLTVAVFFLCHLLYFFQRCVALMIRIRILVEVMSHHNMSAEQRLLSVTHSHLKLACGPVLALASESHGSFGRKMGPSRTCFKMEPPRWGASNRDRLRKSLGLFIQASISGSDFLSRRRQSQPEIVAAAFLILYMVLGRPFDTAF